MAPVFSRAVARDLLAIDTRCTLTTMLPMAPTLTSQSRLRSLLGNVSARIGNWLLENSLATKILVLTVGGQLVLFAALAIHNSNLIEESLEEPFKVRVESMRPLFNTALAPLLVERNYAALADRLQDARSDEDIQYLVVRNADDAIVASAGWNRSVPLPLASKKVLDNDGSYDAFLLIEANGSKYGTLNFGLSTRKLASYRDELRDRGFAIIAAGMLLIGAIQAWLAYQLTRRLRHLSAASEKVALGHFDLQLDDSGNDEVARLATSMNTMSRAIRDKIRSLENSEERLRLAMDAGSVVPWERDLADDTLRWGAGVERLLGPLPDGQSNYPDLLTMVDPHYVDLLLAARKEAIRDASAYRCDIRIRRSDGAECWLAVRGKFVRRAGSDRGYLIGVARNITAGKRAELEIQRLNQELERRVQERTGELQAAVKELEAFSYTISHDLRAPLRALSGFSSLLKEEIAAQLISKQAELYLERIATNATRMSQMLDDLLLFSKVSRSPLKRREVRPEQLVTELLRDLQFPEASRAEICVLPMRSCPADPALLRQVYANLISNALKYSGKTDRPRVEIGSTTGARDETVYYVRDNGAGFDASRAGRLFGVFQRFHSSREFEGTGVGLAIVQRIVTRHGGRIWANSTPGNGASFHFTLSARGQYDDSAPEGSEPVVTPRAD
jgi:PAS domain S-box-containing protein